MLTLGLRRTQNADDGQQQNEQEFLHHRGGSAQNNVCSVRNSFSRSREDGSSLARLTVNVCGVSTGAFALSLCESSRFRLALSELSQIDPSIAITELSVAIALLSQYP